MPKIIIRRPWRVKDLSGQSFGRLQVIKQAGWYQRNALWLCRCTCGHLIKTVGPKLRVGHTNSCGCFKLAKISEIKTIHGEAKKDKQTIEYKVWCEIKRRCFNKKALCYSNYGGRGIKLYPPWKESYTKFLNYLLGTIGRRPLNKDWSINRINNNGNYEPGNIEWANRSCQNKNRRAFFKKKLNSVQNIH